MRYIEESFTKLGHLRFKEEIHIKIPVYVLGEDNDFANFTIGNVICINIGEYIFRTFVPVC